MQGLLCKSGISFFHAWADLVLMNPSGPVTSQAMQINRFAGELLMRSSSIALFLKGVSINMWVNPVFSTSLAKKLIFLAFDERGIKKFKMS